MAEEARDSGICDCDDSVSLKTSSSYNDFNQLSYVQRLRKRFECLAKEQEKEFHAECNWWLEEEGGGGGGDDSEHENEGKIHDVKNKVLVRNASAESEKQVYSKQSSIKSQISHESTGKITIIPATPEKTISMPLVTFSDYQGRNETNDSDSFDSDEDDEEEEGENEQLRDEIEEELPEEYIRNSRQSLKLLRPISITSQTSK